MRVIATLLGTEPNSEPVQQPYTMPDSSPNLGNSVPGTTAPVNVIEKGSNGMHYLHTGSALQYKC